VVQYLVESETIFGAERMENRGSLMSCSVCPGFDEEDFNWPCRDELVLKFPLQKDIIERLHYRSEKSSM
jgi:predicted cupin superfamily sugar epimerase